MLLVNVLFQVLHPLKAFPTEMAVESVLVLVNVLFQVLHPFEAFPTDMAVERVFIYVGGNMSLCLLALNDIWFDCG